VSARDRNLVVAVVDQPASQQARINVEILSADRLLDDDLPEADGAEQKRVSGVAEQAARLPRQLFRLSSGPQQDVGVE
jgi:hypothetical protein